MNKILPLLAVSVISSINAPSNLGEEKIITSGLAPHLSKFSRLSGLQMSQGQSIFSYIRTSSRTNSSSSSLSFSSSSSYSSASSSSYPSSSSSSSISSSYPSENEDYFSCPKYGPFPLSNTQNINVTFTYELNTISSQTLIERVRILKSGSVVSASSQPSFSYTKGQRKNVTFALPISDYWTSNGLELRFEILNSSRTVLKAFTSSFYPPSYRTISSSTLKSSIYESNSLGFYGDGYQMRDFKEVFDFRGIGDYIDNDYYYRLDISKNYFFYPNDTMLSFKSVYLRFNDDENLFPYYTHQDNGDIEVPLYLYLDGNHICFGFNRSFYLNRRTLEISDQYQPGWISTNSFYLPVNGRKKFNGKTIYFHLNELGYDKISTTIPLKYELDHTIVGVCTDGEYCVVGGNN